MKVERSFLNKRTAMSVAKGLECVCYIIMFFMALSAVLSLLGRQEFILHTPEGTFNDAIYSEKDHNYTSRALTANMKDKVYVTSHDGTIDIATRVGLSAMYLVTVLPIMLSFYYLSRVLKNVGEGDIFTEANASYLLYYGLLQMLTALAAPFVKLFICFVTDAVSSASVAIASGSEMAENFIPNLAFIVAAYIIQYGIQLQDEADHTL